MAGESTLTKIAPKWILDRRASGKLFWRRESIVLPVSEPGSGEEKPQSISGLDRVKFRYDVEVHEIDEAEVPLADCVESQEELYHPEAGTDDWDGGLSPSPNYCNDIFLLSFAIFVVSFFVGYYFYYLY